jgi:hypothetical protein
LSPGTQSPQVFGDHFVNQIVECHLVLLAELARSRRIAAQRIDLGRTEIAGVNFHQFLAGGVVDAEFIGALPAPSNAAADHGEGALDKFAHRVTLAGRQHIVVGFRLLHHRPHANEGAM